MSMPYGALIYDPDGFTWAYTTPEELVYVRAPLTVDRIDGDQVMLEDATGATVNVTQTDIGASNGVIHVIDGVLMPG